MNYRETLQSVTLVLETDEVPLIVGASGIGKTALAKALAEKNKWELVVIDGNLLKEGEIGGLPIVTNNTTSYAVHTKLRKMDNLTKEGKTVLLFIDEINRCEHTVQQELMNLILNREINDYVLSHKVKIIAAMNPTDRYDLENDYQVVEMDPAQENRFVWLEMESDPIQWTQWAMAKGLEEKVIQFIATFPEYLNKRFEGELAATPRSYERVSKLYRRYQEQKETVPRTVFLNVLKGNLGKVIAEAFLSFVESDEQPLITYEEVFETEELTEDLVQRITKESHTRLYLTAIQLLERLEKEEIIDTLQVMRFIQFLECYPMDLKIGVMKEMRRSYPKVYEKAINEPTFVDAYFHMYKAIRG